MAQAPFELFSIDSLINESIEDRDIRDVVRANVEKSVKPHIGGAGAAVALQVHAEPA